MKIFHSQDQLMAITKTLGFLTIILIAFFFLPYLLVIGGYILFFIICFITGENPIAHC